MSRERELQRERTGKVWRAQLETNSSTVLGLLPGGHSEWTRGTVSAGRNGSVNPAPIICCTLDLEQVSFQLLSPQKHAIIGLIALFLGERRMHTVRKPQGICRKLIRNKIRR